MWNLVIAMKVFGHPTVESFRRELKRNSQLRKICGIYDEESRRHLVPPSRVFSRFISLLSRELTHMEKIFNNQVNDLYTLLPGFGRMLAGDGKFLDSKARKKSEQDQTATDRRTENDAEWSVKEYHYTDKNGKAQVKKEYHFGFKAHIICDINSELPVAFSVTKANADERAEMIKLINCPILSDEEHRRIGDCLMLDRGYDSIELIKAVKRAEIKPIVDIRNCWKNGETTKQYKDTDIVYDYQGNVFFVDDKCIMQKMKYEGYDKQKKCLRYSYNGQSHKIYTSYDERVFLPIARDSKKFKRLYNGRTAVERLNSRLDMDYMFEDHFIRGLDKMKTMVCLSLLIMNGMAIGKIKNGKKGLRSLKTAA